MDDTKPLETVTDMGYISVGWNIDPEDWKQPPAEQIVRSVIKEAQKNERHIVLLHDAAETEVRRSRRCRSSSIGSVRQGTSW